MESCRRALLLPGLLLTAREKCIGFGGGSHVTLWHSLVRHLPYITSGTHWFFQYNHRKCLGNTYNKRRETAVYLFILSVQQKLLAQ